MKNILLIILSIFFFQFSFSQKKELKIADKLIKAGEYDEALITLNEIKNLVDNSSDNKIEAKYYYLKGMARYQNGSGSFENKSLSIKDFNETKKLEEKSGSKIYSSKIADVFSNMFNEFVTNGNSSIEAKLYEKSYKNYEAAYRVSSKDTLYLRNAAIVANEGKFYDVALNYYLELVDLGFTGISMSYKAVDKETGELQTFQDKNQRDIAVDFIKSHTNPSDELSESVEANMLRTIAAIYKEKGELDIALNYVNRAKVLNREDINIILLESVIRYDMGDEESYLLLIEKALSIDPNNVELIINQGIVTRSQGNNIKALEFFIKAIEINPNSRKANLMAAVTILEEEEAINEQMNSLAEIMRTDKDFEKYDNFKDQKKKLYRKSIPYLDKVLELDPYDIDSAKTLKNIYQYLDDSDNVKKYESMISEIERVLSTSNEVSNL